MSTKVQNFIEKMSFSEYTEKSISKEYSLTILILLIIKLFTSVISISSGFYFVYALFLNMLSIKLLSLFFAFISLSLLELVIYSFMNKSFKFLFIKDLKQAFFTFLFTIVFYSISFYISTKGIKAYTLKKNDLSVLIDKNLNLSIDSIKNAYSIQKSSLETQVKSLQNIILKTPSNANLSENTKSYIVRTTNMQLKAILSDLSELNTKISEEIERIKKNSSKRTKNSQNEANDKANKYFLFVSTLMIIQFVVSMILSKFFSLIYFERESYINQRFQSFSKQLKNTTELIVIRDMQEVYNNAILALNSNNREQSELNTNENKSALGFKNIKAKLNSVPGTGTTSTHARPVQRTQKLENEVTNKHTHVNARNTHVHGKTTCLNCNTEFEKKSHNHKFCSELCRLEYYEKRTNKDISYLKKLHKK